MAEKITVQAISSDGDTYETTIENIISATVHENGALSVRTATQAAVFAPGFWSRSDAEEYDE